jgi:hypothetical protein
MSYSLSLRGLVSAELAVAVPPPVTAMAVAIAARHPGAMGVLFYGSCLREQTFDGLMLDFYLIVESYDRAFDRKWLAAANRLLPPNVFPFEHDGLVAKYAVLSADDFVRLNGPDAETVSVWARFAQPSRLVWTTGETATGRIIDAITLPMLANGESASSLDIWREGFRLTYGAELRAERANRPGSVVDADPDRYERFGTAIRPNLPGPTLTQEAASARWVKLRRNGKLLTLARLAKASATYAGGIDYLAWKISRHSGQTVEIRPWQRRWPILGAITLLPRLIAKGAIR